MFSNGFHESAIGISVIVYLLIDKRSSYVFNMRGIGNLIPINQ